MKNRMMLSIFAACLALSSSAQQIVTDKTDDSTDRTTEVLNSLVQKVDSLEQELAYQKLLSEVTTFELSLEIFSNNINNCSQEIQLYILNKVFYFKLYDALSENYKSIKRKLSSYTDYVDVLDQKVRIARWQESFSTEQQEKLESACKIMKLALNTNQTAFNVYKITFEQYQTYM